MIKNTSKRSFKAGMYLLETLTSGMYNDPLSIYREYIQNSVDSIDMGNRQDNKKLATINVDLDPRARCITIHDNGLGVPAEIAESILSSIGSSNKQINKNGHLRGFRGIGRLGGIAFSDKVIFRTKAEGENIESIQEWDCLKLRRLFETKKYTLTLKDLFSKITLFSQRNGLPSKDSYFEVSLKGVSSFRNQIFDIAKIRSYISQVAPVPFNYDQFPQGRLIDEHLIKKLSNYGAYNIVLNGNPIFKPYSDTIKTSEKRGGVDTIKSVRLFDIDINKEKPVAYGWYGERQNLLGSIKKGESYSGIRIRVGNILLGDAHLLDRCFREDRFNSYMMGEIHVDSNMLIPNSRRDDFIDNSAKTFFYNEIEKMIGLPISKEIRLTSRICSNLDKNKFKDNIKVENLHLKSKNARYIIDDIENEILSLCGKCGKTYKILSKLKIPN